MLLSGVLLSDILKQNRHPPLDAGGCLFMKIFMQSFILNMGEIDYRY